MVAWVLVCAVVLILVMPPIASGWLCPNNWAGAWVGGVIDNTGAVVAAGGIIGGDAADKVAAMVKMAQNVLIGVAAFLMALWATMTPGPQGSRPGGKAVLHGDLVPLPQVRGGVHCGLASIVSFLLEPVVGRRRPEGSGGCLQDLPQLVLRPVLRVHRPGDATSGNW